MSTVDDTIEALIFDCDGTLVDSMPTHYRSWQTVAARHGIAFTEQRFYELAGMPSRRVIKLFADEAGVEIDVESVVAEREVVYWERIHEIAPIDSVVQVAANHRGLKKLAVASGGIRPVVERQLEVIGVLDWFESIVTAEDVVRHKPDPDSFLEAARRLGVAPERCRVYEDADLGVEAARRAGMQVVDIRSWSRA
ncbi:MAG: HAD family phosphatase [Planctomycetales bacterium]|nr:HAD family phosphatase [Planctomycetales bacterium]